MPPPISAGNGTSPGRGSLPLGATPRAIGADPRALGIDLRPSKPPVRGSSPLGRPQRRAMAAQFGRRPPRHPAHSIPPKPLPSYDFSFFFRQNASEHPVVG